MSNVIVTNNEYKDENALGDVFNYCCRNALYAGGYGVRLESAETALNSMKYIKEYHGKNKGKQVCHIVVGVDTFFDTGRVYTPREGVVDGKELDKFADDLSEFIYKVYGYQNCYFKHVGRSHRHHVHYVINPVHVQTGKKLDSHSQLAYNLHSLLEERFPLLKWCGVKYNSKDYDEWK